MAVPPRYALIAIAWVACGDPVLPDDVFTAVSGSRLALQLYRYEDGTQQSEPNEFYDTQLHTRCMRQRWIDDVVRCVPVADDAVYVDAACQRPVGRALTIGEPTHFIAYEWIGARVPARVYSAGAETAPAAQFYAMRDGVCVGPLSSPDTIRYYELVGEIAGSELVHLRDGEVGEGRLALRVRETDDGLRVPFGLRDRELDVDCTPALRPDGGVTCEPTAAVPADHYRDPACSEPVVVVAEETPAPTIATVVDPLGCLRHHAVGLEVSPPFFRRDRGTCRQAYLLPSQRAFTVEAPLDLPTLERTIEDVADRRLQRILLSHGELRVAGDRLLDTATRAECRRHTFDDTTRCVPAAVAAATTLFTAGCAVAVRVAELPQRTCERLAFATATTAEGLDIHAIGDRVSGTLHYLDGGTCQPYPGASDTVLRTLGPPIDPRAFMAAVYFGER